jgi:hypothetical protein
MKAPGAEGDGLHFYIGHAEGSLKARPAKKSVASQMGWWLA